ncbi:hypothetical protein VWZ88_18235 [Phaeobacter sp. JH20_36]
MKNANKIRNHSAPAPRVTKAAALLVALALSLPVGLVLMLLDLWVL